MPIYATNAEETLTGVVGKRYERLRRHVRAIRDNPDSWAYLVAAMDCGDFYKAVEAWIELDGESQRDLWGCAPTFGGFWRKGEREKLREALNEARKC